MQLLPTCGLAASQQRNKYSDLFLLPPCNLLLVLLLAKPIRKPEGKKAQLTWPRKGSSARGEKRGDWLERAN